MAEKMARLAVHGKAGLLRIGFGIASLAAGLPDILTRFRQHSPAVQVSMRDMPTPNTLPHSRQRLRAFQLWRSCAAALRSSRPNFEPSAAHL
jgi:hypothetical protein